MFDNRDLDNVYKDFKIINSIIYYNTKKRKTGIHLVFDITRDLYRYYNDLYKDPLPFTFKNEIYMVTGTVDEDRFN